MTCSSAAVEPTSDSALPIRAKLSEDPNIVGRKGGMTCSSAAVEPTSDSALPIRAKLFGGPDKICTWPPLSPKIKDFRGPRDFSSPFERSSKSPEGVPRSLTRVPDGFKFQEVSEV